MITRKAFNARLSRTLEDVLADVEADRGRIFTSQAHKGHLKSGGTIKLLCGAAGERLDAAATKLLHDLEQPMSKKDREAAWQAVEAGLIQVSLGVEPRLRLDLISDRPSVLSAARNLLSEHRKKLRGRLADHRAGFDTGIARDPHRNAMLGRLERFAEANKALVAILAYLAGIISTLLVQAVERLAG